MPSRRTVLSALATATIGAACRAADPGVSLDAGVNDIAERYVRVALKLAQHQPDLVETYVGPSGWRPGPRVPVAGLLAETAQLAAALAAIDRDGAPARLRERMRYLTGQVAGLRTAARRLNGETMRFADEARDAFGIEWSPRADEARAEAHRSLEALLPGKGSLSSRYAEFRQRHALARELLLPVFEAAVAACRARVATHLRLPEGEHLVIEALEGGGFEARAMYLGGFRTRIAVATSSPTDLVRLVRLAAHEAYPGHHLQHAWADQSCVREQGWTERTLHPAFGPHVLIAEGAAEAGAVLLLEPHTLTEICSSLAAAARAPVADVGTLVAVDRAVTALDESVALVAQAYLDGAIGSERALDRLRNEALVTDPSLLLAVLERQRTRVLAYPLGRRLVTEHVFAQPAGERWAALQTAATIPTLVSSNR